jgi:hypothetical protein
MSGQLVGEVLDAAEAGQLDKLSPSARWALVVIAERCHHISRQGSVRRTRIQAAIGAHNSLRTVSRAVCELRDAGFIRIVKNGYKAPGQLPRAAVYELSKLTPLKDGASLGPSSRQNQPSSRQNRAKLTPSMDGALDGSYDGTLDGGRARVPDEPPNPRTVPDPANAPPPQNLDEQNPDPDDADSPYCPRHPGGTDEPCWPCQRARQRYEAIHPDPKDVPVITDEDRRNAALKRDCPKCEGYSIGDGTGIRPCRPDNPIPGCPVFKAAS